MLEELERARVEPNVLRFPAIMSDGPVSSEKAAKKRGERRLVEVEDPRRETLVSAPLVEHGKLLEDVDDRSRGEAEARDRARS